MTAFDVYEEYSYRDLTPEQVMAACLASLDEVCPPNHRLLGICDFKIRFQTTHCRCEVRLALARKLASEGGAFVVVDDHGDENWYSFNDVKRNGWPVP